MINNLQSGILVFDEGKGYVSTSLIANNDGPGLLVSTGGDPEVVESEIRGNRMQGASVTNKGLGRFKMCRISTNVRAGFLSATGGNPHVDSCHMSEGLVQGVLVDAGHTQTSFKSFNACSNS